MMIHVRAVPLNEGAMSSDPRAMARALAAGEAAMDVAKKQHTTVACYDDITLEELYSLIEMNLSPALVQQRRQLFLPSIIGTIHLDSAVARNTKICTNVSPGLFTLAEMNLKTPISAEDSPVHVVLIMAPCRHPYKTVGRALRRFLEQNTSMRKRVWDTSPGGELDVCSKVFWNGDMLPTMAKHSFTRGDQLQLELLKTLRVSPLATVRQVLPHIDARTGKQG
jgi:hypothetical protein